MNINHSELIAGLRRIIPALKDPVGLFVDKETELLSLHARLVQEPSTITQQVLAAPPEFTRQHQATFEAGRNLQEKFLNEQPTSLYISARPIAKNLNDLFNELSLAELIQLSKVLLGFSHSQILDVTETQSNKHLIPGVNPADFDAYNLKALFTNLQLCSTAQQLLKIVEQRTNDKDTSPEEVTETEFQFRTALKAFDSGLKEVYRLEENPIYDGLLWWAAINHPDRNIPKDLNDNALQILSDQVDLFKALEAKEHKEHIEAGFVKFAEEASWETIRQMHWVRAPMSKLKPVYLRELGLDKSTDDFANIDKFQHRRVNTKVLAKTIQLYIELSKIPSFLLLIPPPGLKLGANNIQGALLNARLASLRAIHLLNAVEKRGKLNS